MNGLVEKLKEYKGSTLVSMLDDELQNEVVAWVENFVQESFVTDDEKAEAINEALNSRVYDIIQTMEVK